MYQGTGELGSEGLRHHSGLAVIASVEVLLSAAHGGAEVSGGVVSCVAAAVSSTSSSRLCRGVTWRARRWAG